jgi:hypothetical protein
MDEPYDFRAETRIMYAVGDLVTFVGYHYSPDFKYIDEDDYDLGVVMEISIRTFYQPIYTVHWFNKGKCTDVIQEHLALVDKEV